MQRMAGLIRAADAVAVVSAECDHGPPAALKDLLDHHLEEWSGLPCGIATCSPGHFGGVRAATQLHMTLAELGMPAIPTLPPGPRGDAKGRHPGRAAAPRHGSLPCRVRVVGTRRDGSRRAAGPTAGCRVGGPSASRNRPAERAAPRLDPSIHERAARGPPGDPQGPLRGSGLS